MPKAVTLVLAYAAVGLMGYALWRAAPWLHARDADRPAPRPGVSELRSAIFAVALAVAGSILIAEPDGGPTSYTWPFVVVLPALSVVPLLVRRRSIRAFRRAAIFCSCLFGLLAIGFLPIFGIVWVPVAVMFWRAATVAKYTERHPAAERAELPK